MGEAGHAGDTGFRNSRKPSSNSRGEYFTEKVLIGWAVYEVNENVVPISLAYASTFTAVAP
jgi:hypothetical protein